MQKEEENVQAVTVVMPHFFNVSLAVVTLRPTLRDKKDRLAICIDRSFFLENGG